MKIFTMNCQDFLQNSRFKLSVKKLSSGKFQVKYRMTEGITDGIYGYVLVSSGTTLREVVGIIRSRVSFFSNSDEFYHQHLYSLGKYKQESGPLMVCKL